MATTKPRVTVTLDPFSHEVISALAGLQSRSRGAVIAEMMEAVAPTLSRTVALLQAAQEAPAKVKAQFVGAIAEFQQEIDAASNTANSELDRLRQHIDAPPVGWDALSPELRSQAIKDGFTPERYDAILPNATRRWARETPA